eukprot:m.9116 g.9116  ORF g.9116 m.9116 type:complete len:213 (+) comp3368_c0_seq1:182-820(+)
MLSLIWIVVIGCCSAAVLLISITVVVLCCRTKDIFEDEGMERKGSRKSRNRLNSDSSGHVLFTDAGQEKINPMFDSRRASTAEMDTSALNKSTNSETLESIEENEAQSLVASEKKTKRKDPVTEDAAKVASSKASPLESNNNNSDTNNQATVETTTNDHEDSEMTEAERKRAERRAKLKATRERKKQEEWEALENSLSVIEKMYKEIIDTDA